MPQQLVAKSPWPFAERLLIFGEGGAGKSTNVLNMARYMPYAQFWVNDTDVSQAYHRLLATEFKDVWDRGQVHVFPSSDWEEYEAANTAIMAAADPNVDVYVVDNGTFPWGWCQDSHTNAMYGLDMDTFMTKLKHDHQGNTKEYMAALADGMQWPLCNKKFNKGFYRPFHKWGGHAILVTQSKALGREKDDKLVAEFKVHGAMPAGQKDLPYVMATNILCLERPGGKWAITTTKDRGRGRVEKMEVTDFARDYLVDVAGWELERVRVPAA